MSGDKFSKERVMELIRHLRNVINLAWFNKEDYDDSKAFYEVDLEDFDTLIEMVRQYDEED